MSNKELFENIIDKKFNKEENLEGIIKKVKRKENGFKLKTSYSVAMVGLVLVTSFYFVVNNMSNKLYPIIDAGNNKIYINKGMDEYQYMIDAQAKRIDIKEIGSNGNWDFKFIDNINVPDGLNDVEYAEIYTRDLGKKNGEYNILHDYQITYSNKIDKSIIVLFSDKYKPLRCLYNDTSGLTPSVINGVEIFISGSSENGYYVEFTHDEINFDINTNGISENELITMLESIIS